LIIGNVLLKKSKKNNIFLDVIALLGYFFTEKATQKAINSKF